MSEPSSNEPTATKQETTRFWEEKPLKELSKAEWEALCDGCAKCCLIQLEDIETSERCYTRIACRLLDIGACKCTSYETRVKDVKGCVNVTPELLETADWLPNTCAYRLIYEGKPLEWWHPLISKDPNSVHTAGISIKRYAMSERELPDGSDLEDYIDLEE